ncbi:hypothetical protein AAFC00_007273 [Neodothiora populina]|uniref:DNA-directed RNA polymerase III subunit RPC6 n=1 Tax=Neodothiora populina TaxID=2781224 RepID=A0ABR3PIW7_9PEZI
MAGLKLEASSEELYDKCYTATRKSAEGLTKIFSQEEMLKFANVETTAALMPLVQGLMDAQLLRVLTLEGKYCYAVRPRDDAIKLSTLEEQELMVYQQIENSGTNGIWVKTIKQRTNIHQTAVTKCMKTLEGKKLVKPVKSIKNPTQRIYMLSHLSPNEDVTGGPWFSEGELDIELIAVTADAVVHFIEKNSWKTVNIKREHRSPSPISIDDPPVGSKRRRHDAGDIEGIHPKSQSRAAFTSLEPTQISYPAGYRNYPTVHAIKHFIEQSGFLKNAAELTIADLQTLLDVLVFDERIEKIGGGYRTVRGVFGATEAMKNMMVGRAVTDAVEEGDIGNGLSQAPCGQCPVFNLCQEGGPVNARNCEYFATWLRT